MDAPEQARSGWPNAVAGWVALALMVASYVALRFAMNREFVDADWASLVALKAPLPYGHRILVPLLVRPAVVAGVSIPIAFAVVEWAATFGLVVALRRLLARFIPPRPASALAVGFLFVLPFAYLLQHRWPIFYPWDTLGMLVLVVGLLAAASSRPRLALLVTAVGALNRETAVLIPVAYLLVHLGDAQRIRKTLAWSGLMVVAFVVVRQGIAVALPDNQGASVRFVLEGEYRVFSNLRWLSDPRHALTFLGGLGLLPVGWMVLARGIPAALHRLHVLAVAVLLGLLVVANAYEPRAFGAFLVLAYVPVAVGVWRWVSDGRAVAEQAENRWVQVFDRFGGVTLFAVWTLAVFVLRASTNVGPVSPP